MGELGTAAGVGETILIGGGWRDGTGSRPVVNPATGVVVSHQAEADEGTVREAIGTAAGALGVWRRTPAYERSQVLARVAALLGERAEEIGEVLSAESGKLLAEAVGEVRFSADYFSWFSGEARRLESLVAVEGRAGGPQMVVGKPVGVVASLTPWNFPVSIQARKVAPALAAGCAVVARPSEQAPLSVVELFRCLEDAGLPAGVANLVTGPAGGVTGPLLEDPRVRLVSFTGSTGVGKTLYERSAATMKRLALELGGCAPFVVLEDADLDAALDGAMIAKFRNCGQSCVAANAFYVHDRLYEDFVAGISDRVRALRLGDPRRAGTTLGPLINEDRRREMERLRERAGGAGLEPVASAPVPPEDPGLARECFFAPEVLAARSHGAVDEELLHAEIFGPLVLVVGFSDLDGLLARLARNPLGLAGYVFSRDVARAARVGMALEVGIVGVNEGVASAANVPMGGVKESGVGREGGRVGLEEFLEPQYLAVGRGAFAAWERGD